MTSEAGRGSDWRPTVVGVLVSVLLGAFFYFRTDVKAAFATFAGLLGVTISLQVESLLRERRLGEAATRQQRLVTRVEALAWLPDLLDRSLAALEAVRVEFSGTTAPDLGRRAFEDCVNQLENLRRGHFEAPFEDNWLLHSLTGSVRKSLLATSVDDVDLDWWHSADGKAYWRLNEEALRRGVEVQRIFIYRDWTDSHAALARRQSVCGVRTLRVDRAHLPPALRVDLIVWDSNCGYEARANSSGEAVASTYTFSVHDLARMCDKYRIIESCAEVWPSRDSAADGG